MRRVGRGGTEFADRRRAAGARPQDSQRLHRGSGRQSGVHRSGAQTTGVVLLVVGGGGVAFAALAGTAVARAGLRPVARLTRATERVAKTQDLTPIPVTGTDELARLTESFNTMLAALAESGTDSRAWWPMPGTNSRRR